MTAIRYSGQPEIIGFLCNWCAYEAADSAGRSQKAYPANLKIIRVMCSGRVDPCLILEAFHQGADGVVVMACRRGECHYKTGNIQALKRHVLLIATFNPWVSKRTGSGWSGYPPEIRINLFRLSAK